MKLLRIFADPRVLDAFGVLRMVCRSRAHQNAWNYLTSMGFFSRPFHPLEFMMLSTCFCGLTKNAATCPPDPAPTPSSGRALSRPLPPLHTWFKGTNIIVSRRERYGQSAGCMDAVNPLFHPANPILGGERLFPTRRNVSSSPSSRNHPLAPRDYHDRVLPTRLQRRTHPPST